MQSLQASKKGQYSSSVCKTWAQHRYIVISSSLFKTRAIPGTLGQHARVVRQHSDDDISCMYYSELIQAGRVWNHLTKNFACLGGSGGQEITLATIRQPSYYMGVTS